MSLGIALNNAISGLKLNQEALSILSQNLANVNTEGYTRKTIAQSAVYIEGMGNGVKIDDVVRKVDTYLQRAVITQNSNTQQASVVNDYYDRLQILLGKPGGTNSIDEDMTTFFNALQQMADQPDRTSYRSNLVSSADLLAQHVSDLAQQMQDLRFQADNDLSASVGVVNSTLKKLFELNSAIAKGYANSQSTAGLMDERDMALKTLSEHLSISVSYEPNGQVGVVAGNGVALLDGQMHQLQYTAIGAVDNLINDNMISSLSVVAYDSSGNVTGVPSVLVTGGQSASTVSGLGAGKMQAYVELRDQAIPSMLAQLDMLANNLRDSMNAIHNDGSGFPAATSLTGTRAISAESTYEWSGSVRIAVLNADGTPVPSGYTDEAYTGIRPLTLDLGALNIGKGNGVSNVNAIIREINSHFGAPTIKTEVGALNNVRLVADTDVLPSSLFSFDLDVENLAGTDAPLFVTGITVKDASGANITNVTQPAPTLALTTTNTYSTTNGSSDVKVRLTATTGLKAGDKIYLNAPGVADVNGISPAELTGYFTIKSISGNEITIESHGVANADGVVDDGSGVTAMGAYDVIGAGEQARTGDASKLQVNLGLSPTTAYYDITVNVGVVGDDGTVKQSQITYRVPNGKTDLMNQRYESVSATGDATRVMPTTSQAALRAIMVDENGVELPKLNGEYLDAKGYLKLVSDNASYTIAIDELDSAQLGDTSAVPQVGATNWGFSHYFGLNDFFAPNKPTDTGETVKNSALNLKVAQRLIDNPNLVSSGKLTLQKQPAAGSGEKPQYTYVRYPGDNSAAQAMAGLAGKTLSYAAAGGLPDTKLTLQGYTSEMLGYLSAQSSGAQDNYDSAQALFDGFNTRAQAVSSVNLDEELSNTVIFQNSYSATARIVSVVDEMFKTLIDTV